jgi:hypothetical protein
MANYDVTRGDEMRNEEPQTRASLRAARQQEAQTQQRQTREAEFEQAPFDDPTNESRRGHRQQTAETGTDAKISRLKHRLNWAIIVVGVLIVLVYLVLFFV